MKILYPDYSNCLTNLANSIAKKFGVYKDKEGLKLIEPYLQKDYENIVVLVLDAMGKNIIDANLKKDGFFHSNLIGVYSSVFPPTTVAATTSLMSGMNPCEHSWLGWDCYFHRLIKMWLCSLIQSSSQISRQQSSTYRTHIVVMKVLLLKYDVTEEKLLTWHHFWNPIRRVLKKWQIT